MLLVWYFQTFQSILWSWVDFELTENKTSRTHSDQYFTFSAETLACAWDFVSLTKPFPFLPPPTPHSPNPSFFVIFNKGWVRKWGARATAAAANCSRHCIFFIWRLSRTLLVTAESLASKLRSVRHSDLPDWMNIKKKKKSWNVHL